MSENMSTNCHVCNGTGKRNIKLIKCPSCDGSGIFIKGNDAWKCTGCDGNGHLSADKICDKCNGTLIIELNDKKLNCKICFRGVKRINHSKNNNNTYERKKKYNKNQNRIAKKKNKE